MQGNVVQGRINWLELKWAVPRLLNGIATLAGGALHVFTTGSIGGAFGLRCGGIRSKRRLVPLGTLAGLIWHGLMDALLWRRVNPLIPLYSTRLTTLFSHPLGGTCLG